MSTRSIHRGLVLSWLPILIGLTMVNSSTRASGVDTSDPSLPVLFPTGQYLTPSQVHAMYNGPGLSIVLNDIKHRALTVLNRVPSGPDEIETFDSGMNGSISVNGSPTSPATANGPVQTLVHNKIGNITGTFQTEMLSMNLSGNSPFGPFMIRESPTLPSLGSTTITQIGGGLFHIDSFFDVFTELSIDGGQTWIPDSTGPARVELQPFPEPSACVLAGMMMAAMGLRRSKRSRC